MQSRVKYPRIAKLTVRGYRGILSEAILQLNGKSLLLFGENGSGKSSYIDALEKLFTDKISSLDNRPGGQGLSSDKYGPHIRAGDATPPNIRVEFDDMANTPVCLGADAASLPVDIRNYLTPAQTPLYILRRSDILKFVDSKPKDRYDLLRPFLPLSRIDQMESTLKEAMRRAEQAFEIERKKWNDLTTDVSRFFHGISIPEQPGAAKAGMAASLSNEFSVLGIGACDDLTALPEKMKEIALLLNRLGDVRLQASLGRCLDDIGQLCDALEQIDTAGAADSLKKLKEEETRRDRVFYETVLVQGTRWIKEEHRTDCPLCEQQIDAEKLLSRIEARLGEAKTLVQMRSHTEARISSVVEQIRKAQDISERVYNATANLSDPIRETPRASALKCMTELIELKNACSTGFDKISVAALEKIGGHVKTLLENCRTQKSVLEANWTPPDDTEQRRVQALYELKQKLERLKGLWDRYEDQYTAKNNAENTHRNAKRLHETAEKARKQEVQSFYDELAGDMDNLFIRIHPDERLGGFKFEVRDVGEGSVKMLGDFYDRSAVDVRGYYSEAHLDTLGLCVFLALRKWERRRTPQFNLLILDDVLLSVDQGHGDRLAKVLFEDFKDYQMFITTHNKIWYQQMIDAQRKGGVADDFVNREIRDWTIDSGPDICDPVTDRSVLEQRLRDGTPAEIAAAAGRLLEHLLQEMRFRLGLSISARRGERYELGDLWPKFYSEVKREYAAFYAADQKILDDIASLYTVRNWVGAHFNDWAASLPKQLAVAFGKAVLGLYDALCCDHCGRFIEVSLTPRGQLSCRCGAKLYSPTPSPRQSMKSRKEIVAEAIGILEKATLTSDQHLKWKREEVTRES